MSEEDHVLSVIAKQGTIPCKICVHACDSSSNFTELGFEIGRIALAEFLMHCFGLGSPLGNSPKTGVIYFLSIDLLSRGG